jgi:hypothetical protein
MPWLQFLKHTVPDSAIRAERAASIRGWLARVIDRQISPEAEVVIHRALAAVDQAISGLRTLRDRRT